MKLGRILPLWFQNLNFGAFKTPQDLMSAVKQESPLPDQRFFGAPPDVPKRFDAPARLSVPVAHFTSVTYLKQSERCDWQYVDPRLMRWAALFVEYARKYNIPLYIHSAIRTEAEQSALVSRKVSRTPYPTSAHNIGEAVDVVHSVFHWEMTKAEWAFLNVLGLRALDRINATLPKAEKLDLEWGGSWRRPWDPAHWQIRDYKSRIRRLPLGLPIRRTPRRILTLFK